MSFIKRWLKKLGEIFSNLAKGANKVWDRTEPEVKQALLWGSGIVAVFNKFLTQDATFILQALKREFPNLNLDEILKEVATDLNLIEKGVSPSLIETVQAIATFLANRTGEKWAKDSEFIANTIALFLSPTGTVWGKIGTIMWWVYQTFIKKGVSVQQALNQ